MAYNVSSRRANFRNRSSSRDRDTGNQDFEEFMNWESQNESRSRRVRSDREVNQERDCPDKR